MESELLEFLRNIKIVSTNPYALVAYLSLVGVWVYIVTAGFRLKNITKVIRDLPEKDRIEILKEEYKTTPRKGLSAEQWLRSRKYYMIFIGFTLTLIAIVILLLAATVQHSDNANQIQSLKPPIIDRTPINQPDDTGITLRQLLEGEPPNVTNKLFDITISNASSNAIILNKYLLQWSYHKGFATSIDHGGPMKPVAPYVLEIPIDVEDDSQKTREETLYPPLLIPPRNESGPSLTTIRLQLHYYFDGRLNYHPCFNWDIEFKVTVLDDSEHSLVVVPQSSWRHAFN